MDSHEILYSVDVTTRARRQEGMVRDSVVSCIGHRDRGDPSRCADAPIETGNLPTVMAVTLGQTMLSPFPRFTLYNSPYVSHDSGCAIDLYPEGPHAPSPVAGEVLETRTVRAPPKPYAVDHDHLILLETSHGIARVLHVDPIVTPGDEVDCGDILGTTIRSGYFAPWVANHIHLGFRGRDTDLYRASGSLRVAVDVPIEPLPWDGSGEVVEIGDTFAVLDSPTHPAPGEYYVGLEGSRGIALDGGCPHYPGGGTLPGSNGPVTLAGTRVGMATSRDVDWDDIAVSVGGQRITGISLFFARDAGFGVKLICPETGFTVGEMVEVSIQRS